MSDEGMAPDRAAVREPEGRPGRPAAGPAGGVRRILAMICMASGALILADALFVEPNWIETARSVEFVPSLRASAPDLTIVHLSDLHVARIGYRERRAIALVNEARPDLVLVSGDLVRHGRSLPAAAEFLGALEPKLGTFVVWGNHDYRDGVAPDGAAALEAAGVRVLRNASVLVRHPIGRVHVAGIDDPVTGRDNLARAMRRVPRRDFCILLSHSPEIAASLGNWDIDMVFAGHTHGGQVRLPLLGAIWMPAGTRAFPEGWFDVGRDVRLHVSRGLGWSLLPLRFFCRPRIDRITLRGGVPPGKPAPKAVTRRS
jgi:hypothetical protein